MRKYSSLIIAAGAIAVVAISVTVAKPFNHRLDLKCYFKDAQGLRAGAEVRVAGARVGSVTSVKVRPELRDQPVEVSMTLNTPYDLKIPSDAVVTLETAGVLGEIFPEINVQRATGAPVPNGGVLSSQEMVSITPQQWAECVSNLVDRKPCNLAAKDALDKSAPPDTQKH
jgi:phospholipid/cholesterol/gamma-HCH transport system substrate-binding protein